MSNKITTTITLEISVEFESYNTIRKNKKALSSIKKWIIDTLKNDPSIPLYIDKNDTDISYIEDCTKPMKVKIKEYTYEIPNSTTTI